MGIGGDEGLGCPARAGPSSLTGPGPSAGLGCRARPGCRRQDAPGFFSAGETGPATLRFTWMRRRCHRFESKIESKGEETQVCGSFGFFSPMCFSSTPPLQKLTLIYVTCCPLDPKWHPNPSAGWWESVLMGRSCQRQKGKEDFPSPFAVEVLNTYCCLQGVIEALESPEKGSGRGLSCAFCEHPWGKSLRDEREYGRICSVFSSGWKPRA